MPQRSADELDLVFHALADPTRRAVIERLGRGPTGTSELAQPFPMALPSFIQHLDVLERSGLVASLKQGRVRIYRLTPTPLQTAQDWMSVQPRVSPFTAIISLAPTASGTRYTAVAMHADADGCAQHADMGFIEGWGATLDQLVELAKNM